MTLANFIQCRLLPLVIAAELVAACASASKQLPELDGDVLGAGYEELRRELRAQRPTIRRFASPGPLPTRLFENRMLTISRGRSVIFDEVAPISASPTPLVVLVHGNRSRKEAHRHQAEHLASYGLHTIVLQLPNTDRWVSNGRTIEHFLQKLRISSGVLSGQVDFTKVVLAGHSFGGSAVTLAAAGIAGDESPESPKICGMVLLDPAVVAPQVEGAMTAVQAPVLLIASDPKIYRARKRGLFYKKLAGPTAELTIAGATHDDAQNPSMYSLGALGVDPFTSKARQMTFTATLTLGAFSLTAMDGLEYALQATQIADDRGTLARVKRRHARTSQTRLDHE